MAIKSSMLMHTGGEGSALKGDGVDGYVSVGNGVATNMSDFIIGLTFVATDSNVGAALIQLMHKNQQFSIARRGESITIGIVDGVERNLIPSGTTAGTTYRVVAWRLAGQVFARLYDVDNTQIAAIGPFTASNAWAKNNNNTPRLFNRSDGAGGFSNDSVYDVYFAAYSAGRLTQAQGGEIPAGSIVHMITNEKSGNTVTNAGTGANGTCVNLDTAFGSGNAWRKRSNLQPYLA